MWRVSALSALAALALLTGLAGGAGAGQVIDKPTLSNASGSAASALADEQLAKFTLMDSGTAAGRAEGAAAIKRSQAAEFPLETAGAAPQQIVAGPDHALWFTEYAANKIGRITTAGKIKQLKLHYDNEGPDGIVALPNGSLAYVTYNDSSVGVITNGKISENEIKNGGRNPNALTVGPGGPLFVTEYTANKVARVAVG